MEHLAWGVVQTAHGPMGLFFGLKGAVPVQPE